MVFRGSEKGEEGEVNRWARGDFRAVKLFCTVHDTTYVSKLTELSSTMIPNVKNLVYLSTLVLFFKV